MPYSRPVTPLARSTLLKMGVRIAVVISLSTLFSYLHMFRTLRKEALTELAQHVEERSTSEEAIFLLAERHHAFLKQILEQRIRALSTGDVNARFDRLFAQMPDGAIRNRPETFDGKTMVGLFVPKGVSVDADLRRRIVASYDVLTQYAAVLQLHFVDTFIILPEGPLLLFWPERPTYVQDAPATFSAVAMEYFLTSRPQDNPNRKTVWTNIYKEDVSTQWMSTVTTPLDMDGRHVASVGHDVMLEQLLARTLNDRLPDTYNIIFRDDGELIAHPGMTPDADAEHLSTQDQQAYVRKILEGMKGRVHAQGVVEFPEDDEYVAVAKLRGTGWNFATVLPESVVSQPALQAARIVLLLGMLSLLLELVIVYWVLRMQITHPLLAFTRAAAHISTGDFKVDLDTERRDELGQLARAFRIMTDRLQQREEQLRAANEGLEQRVEERTRELKEVHHQLVQTARRTGMAEIATNVLHNVGNVLNSVYTSSQVAKERMAEMRLERVGRVAQLLQERQADLTTFVSEDQNGRNVLPFLDKLGQNLLEERQAVVALLDDVGRYTEHIGEIVKVQQDYARTPRVDEPVHLGRLVEDALRINAAGLLRHQVRVEQHLASLPPLLTDKHKALMILVNLVSNAKYALDPLPADQRRLVVRVEKSSNDRVRIELHDNGMGIAPEMLTRIFQYGFTTREEGHGFGLHSSALAAQELGGSLSVHSDGPGRGATFTLELPYLPALEDT